MSSGNTGSTGSTGTSSGITDTGTKVKIRSLQARTDRYLKRLITSTDTLLRESIYDCHPPSGTAQGQPISRSETLWSLEQLSLGVSLSDIVLTVENATKRHKREPSPVTPY